VLNQPASRNRLAIASYGAAMASCRPLYRGVKRGLRNLRGIDAAAATAPGISANGIPEISR